MLPANFGTRRLALILALTTPLALTSAHAVSTYSRTNAQFQELADTAALAGVNSLAASTDQPEDARIAAAIAAASNSIARKSGVIHALSPSIDHMTMSVTIDHPVKGTRTSSTAHYVSPGDAASSPQASTTSNRFSAL
jgi:hypothetical protein